MNAIKNFIVKFDEEFNGKIEKNGVTIFLSSIYRDRKQLNKYGQVTANPIEYPGYSVKEGEYVWFHHNIAGKQIRSGPSGIVKIESQYLVDPANNLYSIPPDLIYAYTEDGEIKCPSPYCFVKPIKKENIPSKGKIWIPGDDIELANKHIVSTERANIENIGEMWFSNPSLEEKGIFKGDTVLYEKESEYEVNIHNEIMWRMREAYIYGKFIEH